MSNGYSVVDIEYAVPPLRLTNEELLMVFPDSDPSQIEQQTGIRERRIAEDGQTAADLAYEAASAMLAKHHGETVDYLLFCTQSADYFSPASACVIQGRLGLPNSTGAIDMNMGCSGYVYGLSIAGGLIAGGMADRVLLLTGDTITRYAAPNDLSVRTIFGDAASATMIERTGKPGIGRFDFGTDGSRFDRLIVRAGGARHPIVRDPEGNVDDKQAAFMQMKGADIFGFTLDVVPRTVDRCLSMNALRTEDIDLFIYHQANKFMLELGW